MINLKFKTVLNSGGSICNWGGTPRGLLRYNILFLNPGGGYMGVFHIYVCVYVTNIYKHNLYMYKYTHICIMRIIYMDVDV